MNSNKDKEHHKNKRTTNSTNSKRFSSTDHSHATQTTGTHPRLSPTPSPSPSPSRDDNNNNNNNNTTRRRRRRRRTSGNYGSSSSNDDEERDRERGRRRRIRRRDEYKVVVVVGVGVKKKHDDERLNNTRSPRRSNHQKNNNTTTSHHEHHFLQPYYNRPHKTKKEEVELEVDPERDQRTVFAYQIAQKADERDIFEFFSQAGKVRDVRLIMDRKSRRSRGVGYVEFVDAMSVPMAIALSGQPLLGQPVMVKPSEAEKNLVQPTASTMNGIGPYSGGARRLYVSNLHLNMKDDQLRQVFEAFGTVEMVQLSTDPETGHCKGFGFVQFARLEDARAAESLNEQLKIAGHLIKVSAVTDQILLETGVNTGDFDDDGYNGLALNGSSRALLMQKLDRSGSLLSVNPLVQASIPAFPAPPVTVPSFDLIGVPSECLMLKNMFDPKIETESDFDLDIKEDIEKECSKFGILRHIFVDKNSAGFVYLRFENTEAATSAQRALHGRWFAGKMITATFMVLQDYEAKFPDSR